MEISTFSLDTLSTQTEVALTSKIQLRFPTLNTCLEYLAARSPLHEIAASEH